MKIISASERLAEQGGIKGVIFGPAKIGKTSLLWTLDPKTTLFLDMEAGGLSVQGWEGCSVEPKTWEEARDIACLLGGPNPAFRAEQSYSQAHYDSLDKTVDLSSFETLFIDSITVAARLCFQWAKGQPQAFSEKTGKPDNRGAYGLLGHEMIAWISQLQHIKGKNIWFVGLLDEKLDEFNRKIHVPQIDGSKTGLELPGIVDQVISMVEMPGEEGAPFRAFVCTKLNPWGYPAGDRSGKLEMIERPHLGFLMEKIKMGGRKVKLTYEM